MGVQASGQGDLARDGRFADDFRQSAFVAHREGGPPSIEIHSVSETIAAMSQDDAMRRWVADRCLDGKRPADNLGRPGIGAGPRRRRTGLAPRVHADPFRPLLPSLGHALDSFRFFRCQIVHLGAVPSQMVQFPLRSIRTVDHCDSLPHQFPITVAHRGMHFMFVEDRFGTPQGSTVECRSQRDALQRRKLLARSGRLRVVCSRHIQDRGHQIKDMRRVFVPWSLRRDPGRPVHEEGSRRPAFVGEPFVLAQWRIPRIGPGLAVRIVDLLIPFFDVMELAAPQHAAFFARAVIRKEQDQGLVVQAGLLQVRHQFPDVLIHPIDHRRIDGHLQIHLVLLGFVQPVPGRNAFGGRRKLPVRMDQAQFDLAPIALAAQLFPAHAIPAAVPVDVFFMRLERPVRRIVSQVQERGSSPIPTLLFQETDRMIRECVRRVKRSVRRAFRLVDLPVADHDAARRLGLKEIHRAFDTAVELLEAPLQRPTIPIVVPQMPLAGHHRCIPVLLQHLGDRHALAIQLAAICGRFGLAALRPRRLGHPADACLVRVQAGHQRGSCRTAAARIMELRKTHASASQRIQVGRRDLAAVIADVGKSQIIDQDDNDVRSFGCPCRTRGGQRPGSQHHPYATIPHRQLQHLGPA